jgi:hypothetical protein
LALGLVFHSSPLPFFDLTADVIAALKFRTDALLARQEAQRAESPDG